MSGVIQARVQRIDPTGVGVARHEERDVFVAGAFDGELVRVELTGKSRHQPRLHGRAHEVLEAHAARRDAPCPRAGLKPGRCGGCPWIALDETAQRAHARSMLAALDLQVSEVIASPEAFGYRRSSKRVAYASKRGVLHLGSWSPRTHVGAWMRGCPVDHPRIAAAFDELEDQARALGATVYDEALGEGMLRYAWAKLVGERLVLTIITAEGDPAPLAAALELPDTIAHSRQPAKTNAIRGGAVETLRGLAAPDALGFVQPNPSLIGTALDDLLRDENGAAVAGARAWDLYAGGGAITERLRRTFDVVVPCERYPESAAALGVEPTEVAAFLEAQLVEEPREAPDLVIANPPRKGMGAAVCDALLRLRPGRLHVMSCGPAGLARDRAQLLAEGYVERGLTAYQSLPQTPHVELVLKLVDGRPKE